MRPTQLGLLLGAIYGVVLVMEGFGEMLIVALLSAIGWVVAAAVTGKLDLSALGDLVNGSGRDERNSRK